VNIPESERDRGVGREDDETGQVCGEFVEESGAGDRFGPGKDVFDMEGDSRLWIGGD
jgi:hypothetical protein